MGASVYLVRRRVHCRDSATGERRFGTGDSHVTCITGNSGRDYGPRVPSSDRCDLESDK